MSTIKRIQPAKYCSIDDLITYTSLPSPDVLQIDPFLVLNHFGPQRYIAENNGLPFYPHSVRGINIISIVLEGETVLNDSDGNTTLVKSGGFHWLNAGNGIKLCEGSSSDFAEKGGQLEVIQLWINLPVRSRNGKPVHMAIQKEKIPLIHMKDQKVRMKILSGEIANCSGAVSIDDTAIALIDFAAGGYINLSIPSDRTILFYVIRGAVDVNGWKVNRLNLVEFNRDDGQLNVQSEKESQILFAFARSVEDPLNNSDLNLMPFAEFQQMRRDFYRGRMNLVQE